jgi:hypothetical protein
MTTQAEVDALDAAFARLDRIVDDAAANIDMGMADLATAISKIHADVVVPPPTVTGDVVLTGNALLNRQWAVGPADRAKTSYLAALVAQVPRWDIFANAEEQFAPSWNGADPTSAWIRCHVYGNFQGLYVGCPRVFPDGVVRNIGSKLGGDSLEGNLLPNIKNQPLKAGPRGDNCGTPFGAVRSHSRRVFNADGTSFLSMDPNIPHYIKVDIEGRIWYYMRSGELRMPFQLANVGGILDWCPVPSSRKEQLFADNVKGCVWHTVRSGTAFVQTKFCDLAGVTSVISLPNGKHYAAAPGGVYEISRGAAPIRVVSIPSAFYLDYFSTGDLCVGALTLGMYRVVVTGGVGSAIAIQAPGALSQSWVWVAVDRPGTCGRKDTVYFGGSHTGINDNILVYKGGVGPSVNGTTYFKIQGSPAQSPGQTSVGNTITGVDIMGHYPWSGVPHEDDACFFIEGESDGQPSLLVRDVGQFGREDVYDHTAFGAGLYIIQYGVDQSQPIGVYPTFTCQMTRQGWSGIGVCADVIAQMPFDEQVAFVQKGMAGSFPRPFLKGRSLYNLLYVINRSSMRFLKEGKALMDALRAYCVPLFGQELPVIPPPYVGVPGSDTYAEVRDGKIVFMNNADQPKAAPATLLCDVYIDEGLPGQQVIRGIPSPWTVIVPSLAPGQHSIRPVVTNGGPTYWGRATVVSAP